MDKNGTLDYNEFQNLLQTIGEWKKMFFKYDRDRSGTLEKDEVYQAIGSLGETGRWKEQRERGEEREKAEGEMGGMEMRR